MNVLDKFKKMWNPPEDEYEYYEDDYEEESDEDTAVEQEDEPKPYSQRESSQRSYSRNTTRATSTGGRTSNKVVNISSSQLKFALFKPTSFGEETRAIADELMRRIWLLLILKPRKKMWLAASSIFLQWCCLCQ